MGGKVASRLAHTRRVGEAVRRQRRRAVARLSRGCAARPRACPADRDRVTAIGGPAGSERRRAARQAVARRSRAGPPPPTARPYGSTQARRLKPLSIGDASAIWLPYFCDEVLDDVVARLALREQVVDLDAVLRGVAAAVRRALEQVVPADAALADDVAHQPVLVGALRAGRLGVRDGHLAAGAAAAGACACATRSPRPGSSPAAAAPTASQTISPATLLPLAPAPSRAGTRTVSRSSTRLGDQRDAPCRSPAA